MTHARVIAVLDQNPIKIGGFVLTASGCTPDPEALGEPNIQGWESALTFSDAAHEASPFWVADLWNYAETRPEWRKHIENFNVLSGSAHETLLNKASVARRVFGRARELAPTFRHADAVASLEHSDQVKVLTQARDENLTSQQTRQLVSKIRRPRVVEGQAVMAGQFRVIYANPKWKTLSIKELCALPIASHATENAVLFIWVPPSLIMDPGPREVVEAWGFTPKTNFVWNMVHGLAGHYSHVQHTHLVVATRGVCEPDVPIEPHDHASIITSRRTQEGVKPPEARRVIRKLYQVGPYLELFGAAPVDGWTVFGNDVNAWRAE